MSEAWDEVQLCFNERLSWDEIQSIIDSLPYDVKRKLGMYVNILHPADTIKHI
jgi:hypothetical protein